MTPCRSNLAVAVAVWARVLLPQLLGHPLPSVGAQKLPEDGAVPRLSTAAATATLKYIEELLALGRKNPVKSTRLGPTDGDTKGTWALKVSDTLLLQQAKTGIPVQVCPQLSQS